MDEQDKTDLLAALDKLSACETTLKNAERAKTEASNDLNTLASMLRKKVGVGRNIPRRAFSLGDGYILLFEYVPPDAKLAVSELFAATRENTRVTIIDGDGKERSL